MSIGTIDYRDFLQLLGFVVGLVLAGWNLRGWIQKEGKETRDLVQKQLEEMKKQFEVQAAMNMQTQSGLVRVTTEHDTTKEEILRLRDQSRKLQDNLAELRGTVNGLRGGPA